jgi:hypothetical protein
MRYYMLAAIATVFLSGCLVSTHEKKMSSLKQDIEILELKKRKAVLQVQIEKVESIEIDGLDD